MLYAYQYFTSTIDDTFSASIFPQSLSCPLTSEKHI